MKKALEDTLNHDVSEEQTKLEESWRKSIPAQVFLNYFQAINFRIQQAGNTDLQQLSFFREFQADLDEGDVEAIAKSLKNSWSTEYALRSTAELGDADYLRNALYWTFPQAYYSVLTGLQAFLYTLNIKTKNPEVISREVSRLVIRHAYPAAINFYAAGSYPHFSVQRLPLSIHKPGLHVPENELEAQAQIGQFLRTSRKQKALAVRRMVQSNNQTALRSPKTGKVLEKWSRSHWEQITWRLGYTSYFDLLSRLRISASNKEIERFVEADIDFPSFHKCLLNIVHYLNGLHEAYVAKAVGLARYQKMVDSLPGHLQNGFVAARLREQIVPLLILRADLSPSVDTAA